ncbi:MAG: isoprenylcysteine carboxylmethyltransferase family protein [Pseudomonadota bacterium]
MLLDIFVCVVGWLIIACHTWSLKYHFDMPVTPPGVRLISSLVIFSAVVLSILTFYKEQPVLPQLVGLAALFFSLWMFWRTIAESSNAKLLAAFDEKLPHGLLNTGPYSVVRHPFYTSYLIQWIGWAIASWSVWGIVPVVFMVTTYYVAAKGEEAKFLRTDMANQYRNYMSKTGRFFPRLIK